MSIKSRLARLDRYRRQRQVAHDAGTELRARIDAGRARLRQAAAEAGKLEQYEAEQRRFREAMAHDPDVIRRCLRRATTSDAQVNRREGE
jgi:hypothetical protein